jgi:hypothetical protein
MDGWLPVFKKKNKAGNKQSIDYGDLFPRTWKTIPLRSESMYNSSETSVMEFDKYTIEVISVRCICCENNRIGE